MMNKISRIRPVVATAHLHGRVQSNELLDPREEAILSCFAEGCLYKEIEDRLHLSHALLRKLQVRIFSKLNAHNRIEAINNWKAASLPESAPNPNVGGESKFTGLLGIAREICEELGSKLASISFLTSRVLLDTELASDLGKNIGAIAQTSRELLRKMDEFVWLINSENDTLERLATYLGHHAEDNLRNSNIECELHLPPDLPRLRLSLEARHYLFLAYEAILLDVIRHPPASGVKVQMAFKAPHFEIKISHNGKGIHRSSREPDGRAGDELAGIGLRKIRQRLKQIGAECSITRRPGDITVTVRAPIFERAATYKGVTPENRISQAT